MTGKLAGASVLITGGTGTFGQAMAQRLLSTGVGRLRIFSRDEAKQDGLRRELADNRVQFYLGDVRDEAAVRRACRDIDYVFHAAALKQVPSCEFFPLEAVKTNIMGSANVIEAATAHGVRSVVCLSTDKAVYPINAMGISKALMEKVAQAYSRDCNAGATVVSTVRYGNVLCSRGSVIPLFAEQARNGVPLTVTNPRMTRFLMSIEDALGLVEHALVAASPGDLFVRRSPAATVAVIANAVARIYGIEPKIEIIGTRHGEKLYETLVGREEAARAEDRGDFFRIPVDGRGLNYQIYFDRGEDNAEPRAEYNSDNAERLDEDGVVKLLQQTWVAV